MSGVATQGTLRGHAAPVYLEKVELTRCIFGIQTTGSRSVEESNEGRRESEQYGVRAKVKRSQGINEAANEEGGKRGRVVEISGTVPGGLAGRDTSPRNPHCRLFAFRQQIDGDHNRGLVCPGLFLLCLCLCRCLCLCVRSPCSHPRNRRLDKEPRPPCKDRRTQVCPLLLSAAELHTNVLLCLSC